jgi:hypothetical protein
MARAVKVFFHSWPLVILAMLPMGQKNSELEGDIRQVRDPAIIKEANTDYVFSTRPLLRMSRKELTTKTQRHEDTNSRRSGHFNS